MIKKIFNSNIIKNLHRENKDWTDIAMNAVSGKEYYGEQERKKEALINPGK